MSVWERLLHSIDSDEDIASFVEPALNGHPQGNFSKDTCSLLSTQLPTLQLQGPAMPTDRCSPTLPDTPVDMPDMSPMQATPQSQPASRLELLTVARPLVRGTNSATSARERSRSRDVEVDGESLQTATGASTADMAASSIGKPSEWWSPPRRLLLVPPLLPKHETSWRPPGVVRWRG
mmetsp:Transcript_3669/g.7237  ORF Transcript_3669/g.7237 Transcript_3669/m.7237 type:complete len:178 (-) Transcript_3669:112-645(-)